MRWWLLLGVAGATCQVHPGMHRSNGPEPGAAPVVDAADPDPMPDQEKEASFILPPDREDEAEGASFILPPEPQGPSPADCEAALRHNQYWCAAREEARPFDLAGRSGPGCPEVIRGSGRDGSLAGAEGLPRCASGSLEPCKTDAMRQAGKREHCCYAWSCPTH